MLASAASAEPLTGRVMGINRLTNMIAIQQTQDGTVGANGGGTEEFHAQDGVSLENVHVEDRVTYSVSKTGGVHRCQMTLSIDGDPVSVVYDRLKELAEITASILTQ